MVPQVQIACRRSRVVINPCILVLLGSSSYNFSRGEVFKRAVSRSVE